MEATKSATARKPAGLFIVEGVLDIRTLWPFGTGDADTLTIEVDPASATFETAALAVHTNVLERASLRGRPVQRDGRVAVRLAGADAPELHVQPVQRGPRKQYRQAGAETSCLSVAEWLVGGGERVTVSIVVRADTPSDLFDAYGRLVGELQLAAGSDRTWSLNERMLAEGWALPAIYARLAPEDAARYRYAALAARSQGRGLWTAYSAAELPFVSNRVFRPQRRLREPDRGSFMLPKLFRRMAAWAVEWKGCRRAPSFREWLERRPEWVTFEDAAGGARRCTLAQVLAEGLDPARLVFDDAPLPLRAEERSLLACW